MRAIRLILLRDHMLIARLGLSLASMLWAIQLFLPSELFPTDAQIAAGTGRITYSLMARVLSENAWGFLFFMHSIASLYSLKTGIRNKATLVFDAMLGCLVWTGSTLLCYAAYWHGELPFVQALTTYTPPAAMSGEAVLALQAWWYMMKHWARDPTEESPNEEY